MADFAVFLVNVLIDDNNSLAYHTNLTKTRPLFSPLHSTLRIETGERLEVLILFRMHITRKYGTPGLSSHGNINFFVCFYHYVVSFYHYVVCFYPYLVCVYHYVGCFNHYIACFTIIWCGLVINWRALIIMWCAFINMWFAYIIM